VAAWCTLPSITGDVLVTNPERSEAVLIMFAVIPRLGELLEETQRGIDECTLAPQPQVHAAILAHREHGCMEGG
jgi:hypothetical protein